MMQYIYVIIPSYGLMAAVGAIAAICLLYYRMMVRNCLGDLTMADFVFMCLIIGAGCLLGSKFIFGLTQIPGLISDFSFSKLVNSFIFGGFVFYGGLIGAYSGVVICSAKKGLDTKALLDTATPSFVLFHIFGRIGCLFAGCCYGFRLSSDLLIGNVRFHYFPLQAVEALFELIMLILLEKTGMKNNKFRWYMLCYPVYRFIAEFFRGDEERGIWFGLSTSQWISLFILSVCIVKCFFCRKNNANKPEISR